MPVEYEYRPADNTVRARLTGVLTAAEVAAYFVRVTDDPAVGRLFTEVVYFDAVEDFAFHYSEAQLIVAAYKSLMHKKDCSGTIFVASTSLAYGVARMLSAVHGGAGVYRIVRSEAELEAALAKRVA